jgi:hypothetical protein
MINRLEPLDMDGTGLLIMKEEKVTTNAMSAREKSRRRGPEALALRVAIPPERSEGG